MSILKPTIISQLGLMGDPKFGYVGRWLGALILVREEDKHEPHHLIVTIGLKTLATDLPPLPKALAAAETKELLTHQRWPDQVRFEIPDPDRIDPAHFIKALGEYAEALHGADCLPDMKCSACMNRQQLDVVAKDDHALLICPNCISRLPRKTTGFGTAMLLLTDKWSKSALGGSVPLKFGLNKVSALGCLSLPLTILGSGILYGYAWYLCLLVLENFNRTPVKLAALSFGLALLVPTYLPLVVHLHWARLRTAARPLFTSWFFVLLLTLIGELAQVIFALGFSDDIPLKALLLSPFITLPIYWQSLGLYMAFVKLLCLLIAIVATTFLASSTRFLKKAN